jgi:hypothetical protein
VLIARELAKALVSGPWRLDDLVDRGALSLGRKTRWLRPLMRRMVASLGDQARPASSRVTDFLLADRGFKRAWKRAELALASTRQPLRQVMWPANGAPASWDVPAIVTPGELAQWLGLTPRELDWFADCQGRLQYVSAGPLRHYEYYWVAKRSGAARLIEAPKARLKAIQRRLLDEILAHIPPHHAVHGFRIGRSIGSFAAPHLAQSIVLRMDLSHFFPSVTAGRVAAVFRTSGYPEPVAHALTGLCTNRTPADVWCPPARTADRWRTRRLYLEPHLPQGAPTSPALANLCAFQLDARLSGLAAAANARYTRYADDLAFSGGPELARSVTRFAIHVAAIALEEGFSVNHHKTRIMRRGTRQLVAGVVVNERLNIPRANFDALKATLHNCAKHGLQSQSRAGIADFRAHLAGRIAHVAMLNAQRGGRLKALFEQIEWT